MEISSGNTIGLITLSRGISLASSSRQLDLAGLDYSPQEQSVWQSKLESLVQMPIIKFALDSLAEKLQPDLYYHDYKHTAEQVLPLAVFFAIKLGLEDRQIELLAISAAWHDYGYISNPDGKRHEVRSANAMTYAMRVSVDSNGDRLYTEAEVLSCAAAVLATRLMENSDGAFVQNASTLLGKILCTADLINFAHPYEVFEKNACRCFAERFKQPAFEIADILASPDGQGFIERTEGLITAHKWQLAPKDSSDRATQDWLTRTLKILDKQQAGNIARFKEEVSEAVASREPCFA